MASKALSCSLLESFRFIVVFHFSDCLSLFFSPWLLPVQRPNIDFLRDLAIRSWYQYIPSNGRFIYRDQREKTFFQFSTESTKLLKSTRIGHVQKAKYKNRAVLRLDQDELNHGSRVFVARFSMQCARVFGFAISAIWFLRRRFMFKELVHFYDASTWSFPDVCKNVFRLFEFCENDLYVNEGQDLNLSCRRHDLPIQQLKRLQEYARTSRMDHSKGPKRAFKVGKKTFS
jgi:hypothetical protein